ncbi:MAG: hypothetical protein ABIJ56_02220 [Pseudomonadota bacterium]
MTEVAKREKLHPTMGQSPFALATGTTFEKSLFARNAERVYKTLVEERIFPEGDHRFIDLRLRQNGGPCRDLDSAMEGTNDLLGQIAASGKGIPIIVAGATVRIPGEPILPEAILVIDVLVIRSDLVPARLIVGEIKTYPDTGGYTDRASLAGARAQAGIYVYGLALSVEELGTSDAINIDNRGFLVLRRPGSNWPRVRASEDLRFQAERARRGIDRLKAIAAELPAGSEGDALANVCAAEIAYDPTCVSFCDRAAGCYMRLMEAGDPSVLGEDVARFLGKINLYRAIELLEGASCRNEAERDMLRRVREARPDL